MLKLASAFSLRAFMFNKLWMSLTAEEWHINFNRSNTIKFCTWGATAIMVVGVQKQKGGHPGTLVYITLIIISCM